MPNDEERKQLWRTLAEQFSNLTARVYPHQLPKPEPPAYEPSPLWGLPKDRYLEAPTHWQPPEPEEAFKELIPRPEEERLEIEEMKRKALRYVPYPSELEPSPYEPSPLFGLPKDRKPIQVTIGGQPRTLSVDKENIVYDEQNQPVAKYNPSTGEFSELPPLTKQWWKQRIEEMPYKAMRAWQPAFTGLYWAIEGFRQIGMATEIGTATSPEWLRTEEGQAFLRKQAEEAERILELPEGEMWKEIAKSNWEPFLPGGWVRERFEKLPLWRQLLAEAPAWVATGAVSATTLSARLAGVVAQGGARGVVAQAGRVALAPFVAAEATTGYVITAPITGLSIAGKKVFEKALNAGLDRWMAKQGHSGIYKNRIIETFLKKNNAWLVRQADANIKKRMAERIGATKAATKAAEDTIKQAEPLLLQASKEVGVKPPVRPTEVVRPEVKPPAPEAIGVKPPIARPEPTVKPEEIGVLPYEEQALRVTGIEAEIGGLREWIAFEPATKLKSLIKKAGFHKGEVYNPTIAQYKAFSGKTPLASILTKDKKHVRWELALDDIATELGYSNGEALKEAIESVGEGFARISSLQGELALYADVPRVTVARRVPLVDEIRQITLELGTEITAARAGVKGLTGDEARIAREVLTGLEREFAYATKTLEGFRKRPDLPDATVLRQTIMAWARYKGLTQKTLQDIYNKVAGKRQLSIIPQEQLVEILVSVKKARPIRLEGKIVITEATEKKIQALKQTLISEEKLTEEHIGLLMEQLKINTSRFESQFKFITEEQGKQLIRALNDEATVGLVAWEIATAKGLKANPPVASAVDDMSARIAREGRVYFEGKPADASVLKDQRFFMEDLETRTGQPFYHTYFLLNRAHLDNRMVFSEIKRRQLESTPKYRDIIRSKESLGRISDYISAKNKWLKVKSPADITPDEIALANELENQLFELIPDYRFHRFVNFYQEYKGDIDLMAREIPDAPKGDIRVAVNIYESRGAGQLRAYLDSRTWGVIKSGFEPHFVVNPRLAMRRLRTTFPSGRFRARSGVEFYPADMNIIQRVDRYTQQVVSYNLQPYIRKLETIYREAYPKLKNPEKIKSGISAMAGEMMGYFERGGWLYNIVAKMASQAFLTVFGTFPVLPFRNLFQNPAFFPDKSGLVDPRNRKLTDWDMKFYHTYISQMEAIPRDLMLAEEGGLPGLGRFNRFIARVNIYGASDSKINRVWSNWAALNKAERALKQYKLDGDIDRFIRSSGMAELTLTQQADVLRTLTLDEVIYKAPGITPVSGEYAAISEIALEITNNVHFLYDRSQRAMVDMQGMGRIVGSLLVFPRSVAQRILKQFKVLDPAVWNPPAKKARAFRTLLAMLLGSMAAGNLFQEITGRKYNPYNPLVMLSWQPGGLALGSVTNLSELIGDIFMALSGDEGARGRIPGSLERSADTFIPYYKLTISSIESAVGMKKIDRLAARETRAIIEKKLQEMGFLDEAYKPNRKAYEVERDMQTKLQHAIFGTEPEPDPLKEATRILSEKEGELGKFIMGESSDDGFDYTMTRYAADIRQAIDDLPPDKVTTENGFSPFVIWYVNEAKPIDDTYRITPWAERAIEEITSEQAQKLRESFRQHAPTEAILFLLGRVKTLQDPDRIAEVESLLKQHKIPREAIPWLDEYITNIEKRRQEKETKRYQEWERRLPKEPELPLEAVD